jgi:transcriptional regulator with XRE-family HTH domain/KaiC/GvpD/RAD55 family RecA-like ATPase
LKNMTNEIQCSTGIEYLDQLIGGLRFGDNVVWETDAGSYIDLFVEKFSRNSLSAGHNLVYISFNRSPATIIRKLSKLPNQHKITLVDAFTSGKGDNDPTFTRFYENRDHSHTINAVKIENPADVSHFTKILNDIEEKSGEGARYIFDSITGMQDLWSDEVKTYRFFTYACPRLYDLNTVAYWILESGAHSHSFKANLGHVTQVVIEVSHSGSQLFLRVNKSEERYSSDMLKPQKFEVWGDDILFQEAGEKDIMDLGGKVKNLRLKKRLTQSELAQKINATASYISQLERNLISPSIDSLILLSNELQVEPGYFFTCDKNGFDNFIHRKSQHSPAALANVAWDSAKCYLLSSTGINRRMQPMVVTIEPESSFSGHFINHKGDEFVYILKGELEFDMEDKSYILREGDSIYLDSVMPTAWRNNSEMPVQAIWILSPPGI